MVPPTAMQATETLTEEQIAEFKEVRAGGRASLAARGASYARAAPSAVTHKTQAAAGMVATTAENPLAACSRGLAFGGGPGVGMCGSVPEHGARVCCVWRLGRSRCWAWRECVCVAFPPCHRQTAG